MWREPTVAIRLSWKVFKSYNFLSVRLYWRVLKSHHLFSIFFSWKVLKSCHFLSIRLSWRVLKSHYFLFCLSWRVLKCHHFLSIFLPWKFLKYLSLYFFCIIPPHHDSEIKKNNLRIIWLKEYGLWKDKTITLSSRARAACFCLAARTWSDYNVKL